MWEKPREFRARAIWKSIYYVKLAKIEILLCERQFSPIIKDFSFHTYLKKKICLFSFLRPKFSFGMLFRQFGNFPKSSCQHTVKGEQFVKNSFLSQHTVKENEYHAARYSVRRYDCFDHLPKVKMTQMMYHLKALI